MYTKLGQFDYSHTGQLYSMSHISYILVGSVFMFPCVVVPLFLPCGKVAKWVC